MRETRHSPLPWRTKPGNRRQVECSPFEDGTVTASCWSSSFAPPPEEATENAALIVRAVNCHDRLITSCKELLDAFEDGIPQCSCERGGFPSPAPCLVCKARDIIAEAESKS